MEADRGQTLYSDRTLWHNVRSIPQCQFCLPKEIKSILDMFTNKWDQPPYLEFYNQARSRRAWFLVSEYLSKKEAIWKSPHGVLVRFENENCSLRDLYTYKYNDFGHMRCIESRLQITYLADLLIWPIDLTPRYFFQNPCSYVRFRATVVGG